MHIEYKLIYSNRTVCAIEEQIYCDLIDFIYNCNQLVISFQIGIDGSINTVKGWFLLYVAIGIAICTTMTLMFIIANSTIVSLAIYICILYNGASISLLHTLHGVYIKTFK